MSSFDLFFFHEHYSAVSVLSSSSVYVHLPIYKHITVCLPIVLLKYPLLGYASETIGITNSLLSVELLPQGNNTSILFFIPCYDLKLQFADIPSYEFPFLTEDGNSDLIWARLWVTCSSFWLSPDLSKGLDWRPGILSSYSVIWLVSFCRGYFRVSDVYENNSRAEVPPWQRTCLLFVRMLFRIAWSSLDAAAVYGRLMENAFPIDCFFHSSEYFIFAKHNILLGP